MGEWRWLDAADRARLGELTEQLLGRLRFEAARGFTMTAEVPVVVAAHAALLVLNLDAGVDCFAHVSSVIVHRDAIVLRGPRPGPGGTTTEAPEVIGGQAHDRGPILVSWAAARRQSLRPRGGEHVVLHEFAHRLDMLDGVIDGTPPLDPSRLTRWAQGCTAEIEALRAPPSDDTAPAVLRPYAATNPAEFFAVATETFFTVPVAVRARHCELYAVLVDFYGQDPAARR